MASNRPVSTYPRNSEVHSLVMADDKVVPFPKPDASPDPDPITKRRQRVIFSIGSQRYAVDLYSQVSQLNPVPASVVPVDHGKPGKSRKPRR